MTTMPKEVEQLNQQNSNFEQETKGKVSQVAEQAQQKAKEITQQAQEQAKSTAAVRKEQAVDELDGLAQAFRQTSQALRLENKGTVAGYSEKAANQIERFSSYLEEHDVDQLLGDAEGLARRHPELFLGAAFAVGLAIGRFIKSSGQRREIVRAGYYHPSSYPPAPNPTMTAGTSTFSENEVLGSQPYYRSKVNNPNIP
jgi:hypothetical protein